MPINYSDMVDKSTIKAGVLALQAYIKALSDDEVCALAERLIQAGDPLFDEMLRTEHLMKATGKTHHTAIYRRQKNGFSPKKWQHVEQARAIAKAHFDVVNRIVDKTIIKGNVSVALCGSCKQELTLVRPGKHQCNNENCPSNAGNSSLGVVIHWVACSERLPERRKRVLVTDGNLVAEAHLNKRNGTWEGYTIVGIRQLEEPIWWAELPKPPCV